MLFWSLSYNPFTPSFICNSLLFGLVYYLVCCLQQKVLGPRKQQRLFSSQAPVFLWWEHSEWFSVQLQPWWKRAERSLDFGFLLASPSSPRSLLSDLLPSIQADVSPLRLYLSWPWPRFLGWDEVYLFWSVYLKRSTTQGSVFAFCRQTSRGAVEQWWFSRWITWR